MQIHKQSSYFFIILYNNIKQHGRKQRVDIKNAGFIRPASTFLDIQLSNSRVGGDSDALLTKCSLQHKINMN